MWKPSKPDLTQPAIFDYRALRLFIGLIAVVLPIALPLVAGHWSFDNFLPSMSDYYHDNPRDLFVGSLSGIAILLFAYNGRAKTDLQLSKIAGVFALGVAFFPVAPDLATPHEQALGVIHNICALGLFIILALFCLFLFPNAPRFMTKEERTARERRRDAIYRASGYSILACIALIGISSLMSDDFRQRFKPVFFLEWIALTAFGISWFTAGKYWALKFLVDEKEAYRFLRKKD